MTSRGFLDQQISLFAIGAVIVRSWRQLALWAFAGAVIAFASVFTKPKLFAGSFAFVPQGGDASRSSLASLAGQFGISTPIANPAQQPDFYLALLHSRELLEPVIRDTVIVHEESDRRVALLDLLKVRGTSPENRVENGIRKLRSRIQPAVVKSAGIVRVAVRTEWPSVSLSISRSLLDAVNQYNLRMRQGHAGAERRFVEGRLNDAKDTLREAEDRVSRFLVSNRGGVANSPMLSSQWQRLEREVNAKTAIVTALTQELEETRIREVRDTPTITVFESPGVATTPDPRRRMVTALVGGILGGFFGIVIALGRAALSKRRSLNDPDADEFFGALSDTKNALLRRLPASTKHAPANR